MTLAKFVPICLWSAASLPSWASAAGHTEVLAKGQQEVREFREDITRSYSIRYLLYLPPGYPGAQKQWPLLLFLHGAGERGDDLELVKRNGPPKMIEEGTDFPFIMVSPQVATGQIWDRDTLFHLLQKLKKQLRVDSERIYLTGLSMGGFGAWDLALTYPGEFAALIPICGGANPIRACFLKEMAIWVFHGEDDGVVPAYRSTELATRLERCSHSAFRCTIYPNTRHNSWTRTYHNPAVWKWLLQQRRGSISPPPSEELAEETPAPQDPR